MSETHDQLSEVELVRADRADRRRLIFLLLRRGDIGAEALASAQRRGAPESAPLSAPGRA
jgi:hypothetical protein